MLDDTFHAISDPTRRSILEFLAKGERSVGEIVDCFDFAQSGISRHLKVLEEARLIARRRDGQRRICSLTAEPFNEAEAWIQKQKARWEGKLDRLEKHLAEKKR